MVAEVSYEIALRWMPIDLTDEKSTLVQVMAWCHEATSHYLSQCWARPMSPNGVTRPQWVKQSRRFVGSYCCKCCFSHRVYFTTAKCMHMNGVVHTLYDYRHATNFTSVFFTCGTAGCHNDDQWWHQRRRQAWLIEVPLNSSWYDLCILGCHDFNYRFEKECRTIVVWNFTHTRHKNTTRGVYGSKQVALCQDILSDTDLMGNKLQVGKSLKSRADSRFAPSRWETSLQSNITIHFFGTAPWVLVLVLWSNICLIT